MTFTQFNTCCTGLLSHDSLYFFNVLHCMSDATKQFFKQNCTFLLFPKLLLQSTNTKNMQGRLYCKITFYCQRLRRSQYIKCSPNLSPFFPLLKTFCLLKTQFYRGVCLTSRRWLPPPPPCQPHRGRKR